MLSPSRRVWCVQIHKNVAIEKEVGSWMPLKARSTNLGSDAASHATNIGSGLGGWVGDKAQWQPCLAGLAKGEAFHMVTPHCVI